MAQILALLALLKKLMAKELSSFSSVGLNNFVFCILFLMSGSANSGLPKHAFWSTLFFQLVLLVPMFVTFSIDTQHRLPTQRVAMWPLTRVQRFWLSAVSFALNPLWIVLFLVFLLWMGLPAGLFFVVLGLIIHALVYAVGHLSLGGKRSSGIRISKVPRKLGGIAQEMWRELIGTLDFWTALLVTLSGTLYRLLGRSPQPEAFPILALFVGIAMSTVAQRMLRLEEGRALLRYRLLPIAGWKLLVTLDLVFLIPLALMVSPLNLGTGIAFGVVAIAAGRYPSLRQTVNQRRWRFVGGDPRFGAAQIVLGGIAGIGTSRWGLWVLAGAFALYAGSVFWGGMLWKRTIRGS